MPRNQSKRIQWLFFGITVLLVGLGWLHLFRNRVRIAPSQYVLSGHTMGTTYSIRFFAHPDAEQSPKLQQRIDAELLRINRILSTYDPESEISAFNRSTSTNPIPIGPEFASVLAQALDIAEKTGGAFDPTVAPLVNLWGFGPDGRISTPPSDEAVREAKRSCGRQHLTLQDTQLRKDIPSLRLDLAAIAKGYGVDALASLLRASGISNAVIEIGGETLALGSKPGGTPWRIGIQKPRFDAVAGEALAGILEITDQAVATSGDYQNFFTDSAGNTYSHILDPRTGRPVDHATAGVTVIAPQCALADALATGLYVMGPDDGLALVETLPDVEALFILRNPDGTFTERTSSTFPAIAH